MAAGDLNSELGPRVQGLLATLRRSGWTLAVAESCTGGMVLAALTSPPGASDVVWGGTVVYASEAKTVLLGITPELLDSDGPVALSTTRELAESVRRVASTTFGAAVTGWAGPDHGDEPAGTTYLAVAGPQGTTDARETFAGDRAAVRQAATSSLLAMIARAAEAAAC